MADISPGSIPPTDGIANVIRKAHLTATDGLPGDAPATMHGFETASSQYFALMWTGLEGLRDLAATKDPRLFEALDLLEADELRWALAQAAHELHESGWSMPVEDDESDAGF